MNTRVHTKIAWIALVLTVLLLLSGCGGSGASSTTATKGGTFKLGIKWPARTRLIPYAANSIVVQISGTGGFTSSKTVNRPTSGSTSTVTISNIPDGAVTITATAYPQTGGSGVAQATATTSATSVAGAGFTATVTMVSTIDHIIVGSSLASSGGNYAIPLGDADTFTATAFDAAGDIVLTSPNTITWSLADTTNFNISGASVTALHPATSTLTATETESGQMASAGITTAGTAYNLVPTLYETVQVAAQRTTTLTGLTPSTWAALDGLPPTLDFQKSVTATLKAQDKNSTVHTATTETEVNGNGRTFLRLLLSDATVLTDPKILTTTSSFSADLYKRTLATGTAASVSDLSSGDRSFYTSSTTSLDWGATAFQTWLSTSNLTKSINETPVAFAFRIASALNSFTVNTTYNGKASTTASTKAGDSGSLALVAVGAFRNSGIPARVLYGHIVDTAGLVSPKDHARLEFFDRSIGWVPFDAAYAAAGGSTWVGNDDGTFLVTSIDPDMTVDTSVSGQQVVYLQDLLTYAAGTGSQSGKSVTDNWTVSITRH